ncbi:MAG: heparan-alpha-glucosaminide N-acetyltransferase domain-containing protein [Tissierellia bacterium]|nr:heparan-alpha-glucosaminide N-acetyltransferase domain-containing protein [Tissierellia bacterium]
MKRYNRLDFLRGFTLVHMVIYHFIYNLENFYGYRFSPHLYYYQQYICWSFILIAGYSASLVHHWKKRLLILTATAFFITEVTTFILPEERILFGIIHFFALTNLIFVILKKFRLFLPPRVGLFLNGFLFLLTKTLPQGSLWFGKFSLPEFLYVPGAFIIGFPADSFQSADYFPLMPWIFLFFIGYYLHYFISFSAKEKSQNIFCVLGRHSLFVYLVHQPLLMALLYLGFS